MGVCGETKNNGKNDPSMPVLLAFFEVGNQEQKQYCIKLRDNFKSEKTIRFEIKSSQQVPFSIRFKVNGQITEVQNKFDNSEEKMNETLQKMYDLLK